MTMRTLEDLYIDQIKDMWSANRQMADVIPELIESAHDEELKASLKRSQKGIDAHTRDLAELCERHGAKPSGEHCKGMEGLVSEVRKHAIELDADRDVQDASIITQFQRMSHYGIAGFGTAKAFAKRLNYDDDAKTLDKDLDSIYGCDSYFTKLAITDVNKDAAA